MPRLMEKIFLSREPSFGGTSLLATGRLGSGKTSLICHIAKLLITLQKNNGYKEFVYWRGQASCQWLKFVDQDPKVPVKVLVPAKKKVVFHRRGKNIPFDQVKFANFEELVKLADPNCVNVIYLNNDELTQFMEYLQRESFEWNSIFIDECEELAPYGASGENYVAARRVCNVIKEGRKYRLSIYATTQGIGDVYWFVRNKFMGYAFLLGASALRHSPVWKASIQSLRLGEAWLSTGSSYEKVRFPPYVSKRDIRAKIYEPTEDGKILLKTPESVLSEPIEQPTEA